tara:strand:+ start:2226 stop:2582 length:357 start_codon:yes stop_codon:yes gene_type:complete
MEELTFKDIEERRRSDVKEIEWLGKRAFVRSLSYDAASAIRQEYAGREDDEATDSDAIRMIAYTLCDADGVLLFPSADDAIKALGSLDHEDVLDLVRKVSEINGTDVEQERVNLAVAP